jgi:hypothetical protein
MSPVPSVRREPITWAAIAIAFALLLLFVGYPLAIVLKACVTGPSGELTVSHLARLIGRHHFIRPIANSL